MKRLKNHSGILHFVAKNYCSTIYCILGGEMYKLQTSEKKERAGSNFPITYELLNLSDLSRFNEVRKMKKEVAVWASLDLHSKQ